jgi:tetratricopeptide (TPR) repeat protein
MIMNFVKTMLFSCFILHSACGWSVAYIPKDDAEVLEHLPVTTGELSRLRRLRSQLTDNPGDYSFALSLAREYITAGRANSDPRYFGYAEAIITPWVSPQNSIPEALVLRATILQNRHDFPSALADLKAALSLNPRLSQAWLTLAAIYEVQGNYPSALRSCMNLARFSNSLMATICVNSALSLSGQAKTSYEQLVSTISTREGLPEEMTWAYTVLAELAERLNLTKEANSWYQKANEQGHRSVYLLSSYADFLLGQNRPAEVLQILQAESKADTLLLRVTLAEQRLQHTNFTQHVELIKARIAAAKARGDAVHQGDEARFNLNVLQDAQTALKLAIENWAVQKEPRDARILMEAAISAKNIEATRSVIKFLAQTHLEDAHLDVLVKKVTGQGS